MNPTHSPTPATFDSIAQAHAQVAKYVDGVRMETAPEIVESPKPGMERTMNANTRNGLLGSHANVLGAVVIDKDEQGAISARYRRIPVPEKGRKDLVIRPAFVGICGTDMEQLSGQMPETFAINFPHTMGHEWSGIVEEVGEEVAGFAKGDRVLGHGHLGGNEWFGVTHDGAMADLFTVPAEMCFKVPHSISLKTAAVIEPFACVVQALKKIGGVSASDTVHVHGLGAIGLMAVIQAVAAGATVIAFDPSPLRRELAEKLGAQRTFEPFDIDGISTGALEGHGVDLADVVVEASGAAKAQAAAILSAGTNGRVLLMGVSAPRAVPAFLGLVQQRNLMVTSSTGAPVDIWPAAIRFIDRAGIDLAPIVSSVMKFDEVSEAIDLAHQPGREIKILLEP